MECWGVLVNTMIIGNRFGFKVLRLALILSNALRVKTTLMLTVVTIIRQLLIPFYLFVKSD